MENKIKSFTLSPVKPYTLSDRWIIRSDPYFHTPFIAFNIDTAEKYKISSTYTKNSRCMCRLYALGCNECKRTS